MLESITTTNEKGRLSEDDINRMIRETKDFVSKDEAARMRINALDRPSSLVCGPKIQNRPQELLGSKIDGNDGKATPRATKGGR
ncbi:hypothetical protein BC834DRAFT_821820 [Gloeopeniophorella convolvens]|nr:hypothetical protein BC834DRAFT_821820 [Gloeopeniophorella convolvens]